MVISIIDSYPSLFLPCLMSSVQQISAATGTGRSMGSGGAGAWICALWLAVCLMGCQPRATQAPASVPLPAPPAAALPRPARPTYFVTINQLSLRACPGTDCDKICTLKLNAEVEKMGESQNWTQIRVKKDGSIGYVSSRYLSPHPVAVAQTAKKKLRRAKPRKAAQPAEPAVEEAAGPQKQGPSPPLPRVM